MAVVAVDETKAMNPVEETDSAIYTQYYRLTLIIWDTAIPGTWGFLQAHVWG